MSRSFLSLARSACQLLIAVAFLTLPLSLNFPADAQAPQSVEHLVVPLHMSITLPVPRAFSSAVVGSPDIADALPMTDRTLYIQGKSIGTTNVSIYDENMRLIKVVDVEVALDTRNLQSKIRATTGGAGIRVTSDNGVVILSGTASDCGDGGSGGRCCDGMDRDCSEWSDRSRWRSLWHPRGECHDYRVPAASDA